MVYKNQDLNNGINYKPCQICLGCGCPSWE